MAKMQPWTKSELLELRLDILNAISRDIAYRKFDNGEFETLDDGGMGSFQIANLCDHESERLERLAAEKYYEDADGIGVVISAYSGDDVSVSSIDFWRVDFQPLKAFPEPDDLVDLPSDVQPNSENRIKR